jgi:8-oxo-dGTP diphosphatase
LTERTELSQQSIDVVAGVIRRGDGRILICLRPAHLDQGGLWEFPGGKRERGESRISALARELYEELGIDLKRATPLLRVNHAYVEKRVNLDVWETSDWDGEPIGKEGQRLIWALPSELCNYAFPAANRTVITAARLPRVLLVVPDTQGIPANFADALESCFEAGIRCVIATAPPPLSDVQFAHNVRRLCRHFGAILQFGIATPAAGDWRDDPLWIDAAVGLHLERPAQHAARARSERSRSLLSVCCASIADLDRAETLGADLVLIPKNALQDDDSVRWQHLADCVTHTRLPAYALGDFGEIDIARAIALGFQGIAISGGMWRAPQAEINAAVLQSLDAGAVAY